jgi:hypothetical protein
MRNLRWLCVLVEDLQRRLDLWNEFKLGLGS